MNKSFEIGEKSISKKICFNAVPSIFINIVDRLTANMSNENWKLTRVQSGDSFESVHGTDFASEVFYANLYFGFRM